MNFLHSEIGSAKDNMKSPIHNWYKFTAGFSYKFVEEVIKEESLKDIPDSVIFDPFAGCGTTLVSAQKEGIIGIGNEAQSFMYEIIKAKINWNISSNEVLTYLNVINKYLNDNYPTFKIKEVAHPLLFSLYDLNRLIPLYLIRNSIQNIESSKYRLFFKLALSQTLHKVALYPIAVPHISRNKKLATEYQTWETFNEIAHKMLNDLAHYHGIKNTSTIYKHDSRKENKRIGKKACNVCITSPPYLNNLDYGEVSKVHTHFFDITSNWQDITESVRKNLVTGSTTHYNDSEFEFDTFLTNEFCSTNKNIIPFLINKALEIKDISKVRAGRKSFNILLLYYFNDMYNVLKEIRRVLTDDGKAYMILGDSAPYGIYIPTTEILGKIACNTGFEDFKIINIRTRGGKWKTLKHRHNLILTENVLILK